MTTKETAVYAEPYSTTARAWALNLKRAGDVELPLWRAPRLAAAGRPFAPTGVEVGAWVTVEGGGAMALGQVWSLAPAGVWVIPADEALAADLRARTGQAAVQVCVKSACRRRCGVGTHLAQPAVALVTTESAA